MICQTCSTWQIKMYKAREKKRGEEFGLLLKQGKVTISIKALTKVEFFVFPWRPGAERGRAIKKQSVFMEMQ